MTHAADTTAEKIRLVMLEIRMRRLRGEIADGEPVSHKRMAAISEELGHPVSHTTFRRVEAVILHKARRLLSQSPIPEPQPRNHHPS